MNSRTKQITQLADIEVAMDRRPTANLKMIHPQFSFTDLKTAFYREPGKGRPQQLFQCDAVRSRHLIRHKILDLLGIEDVAGNDQIMGRSRQAVIALSAIKSGVLDLPYDGTFFTILNPTFSLRGQKVRF
jgi:hypothetical protein